MRLLLIEDNQGDARLIRELLTEAIGNPIDLRRVERLEEGIAALETFRPDVVLLDLSLPDTDGVETFQKLHEAAPDLPVVVLTGTDDGERAGDAIRRGAQDFLPKASLQGPLLERSVRYAIERQQLHTARRKAEEALRHAQKLESLGVLAGGIANDFNNLLTGVLGNASLAMAQLSSGSPVRGRLHQIETAALRAAELTRQLLAYSGRGRFIVEAFSLNDLLQEMVYLLDTVVSRNARLKWHLAPSLPAVEGDETQIRQVVMNLMTNASDAIGSRDGIITISTGTVVADRVYLATTYLDDALPDGDYVYLEITDDGIGMDEDTVDRIFDPFFTTKFTGRGLGLAAVLGIVRGHQGAVKVFSELGQGTTVRVLLPASAKIPAKNTSPTGDDSWRGSGMVLVIDDEEVVRKVCRATLEDVGFTVETARDGREGVERFRQLSKDGVRLILLDVSMPILDGPSAFREIRRLDSHVPVVLMSGYDEDDIAMRFNGQGIAGFIHKPHRAGELVRHVRNALDAVRR